MHHHRIHKSKIQLPFSKQHKKWMAFAYQNQLLGQTALTRFKSDVDSDVAPPPMSNSGDVVANYSAVAFLPIIMIVVIVIGICSVYQYRKWKHERRQMEHLSNLYEILESSPCPHARKSFSPMKDSDLSPPMATNCERISRAVSLPLQETSPFFQPSARNKTLRAGGLRHINNAEEVFFHFTNLANNSPLLGPRQHQAATAVVVPQQPQPKYERQNGTFYQKVNGDVNGDYHEAYIIQEI